MPKLLAGKRVQPLAGKLSTPKLPGLPRPNFSNLARTIRTPAAEAIATRSSQPPTAPAKIFDTSAADAQMAAAKMPADVKSSLDRARKAAQASRDAIETSRKDFTQAVADTKAPKTEDLFSKIRTKPTPTSSTASTARGGSNSRNKSLWGDYDPDLSPSSSNSTSGGLEELAKVNPSLYDRYGKLTSSKSQTDGPLVAINAESNFDFQPRKTGRKPAERTSSDDADATIASLRSQLMELRSRGTGTSDQLKMPYRSAIDIAGIAPAKPIVAEPEQPIHRGFGDAAALGERQQTVSIPDPTAPTNILRPAHGPVRGLVASHEIKTSSQRSLSSTLATELPLGGTLSSKRKSSDNSSENSGNKINNDFVESPTPPAETDLALPILRGEATERVIDMELPRKLSQASLNALEEAKQRELNKSLPEINLNSDPFVGASPNPKIASDKAFAQTFAPPSIKNGQPSSAFPSHFPRQNLASRQQVTANQFFNRAAKPAVEKTEAEARVAEVKALALPLPKGITTGDSTYSPGSVRSLEKKLW